VIWLGWRQQRTETLISAVVLALVAALLVPTGIEMAHAYTRDGLSHCLTASGPTCGNVLQSFHERFNKFDALIGWFNLLPGLFGVALAAPFALELERGTHRLAWTQSITRRRWVVTKLGLAVGSTLVAATVLIAILVWWRAPLVRLDGRMDNGAFDSQGTVILGYSLFALGLALAIGALWRRGIPAVMVSFVAYFVARIFVDTWLRQRFLTPHKLTFTPGRSQPRVLDHAWMLSQHVNGIRSKFSPGPFGSEVVHVMYFPASSFWTLQAIETALFGGIGVALVAFAAWWVLRSE
jgi:hypothetical protein